MCGHRTQNLFILKYRERGSVQMLATQASRLGSADAISVKTLVSGGFRNLERGVQPLAREAQPKMVGVPHPLPVT